MSKAHTPDSEPHPTCIDCEHALELVDDPGTVACAAHLEYFSADKPATCSAFDYRPEYSRRQPQKG